MEPRRKLAGYDFYRQVLGSPRFIAAPMVDQSELGWRILSRKYGAELAYTPMINAKVFVGKSPTNRQVSFNTTDGEEGGPLDRPLIVQFCANNPEHLLAAARIVEPFCDAVDINLGCPQDIARKGHYGSFLQDEWDLVFNLINVLHLNLDVPVTAKFRVFQTVERTVEYARMLERAGAQILTCHGRTREQRGHNSGLADWAKIRAVKEAVSVPVFANGNILFRSDITRCLEATGADGVMAAEGQLYNAALFHSADPMSESDYNPPHCDLALEYLAIVKGLKTRTPLSAVKGHVFKLLRPALVREPDVRDRLARVHGPDSVSEYEEIVREMKARMDRDASALEVVEKVEGGVRRLPHWLAQPYVRPLPQGS